jgi:hypothetical protein
LYLDTLRPGFAIRRGEQALPACVRLVRRIGAGGVTRTLEDNMDENPRLMVQKAALLKHLREALREAGYDGSDGSDNVLLMTALCDLVAMLIAATADDIEATTRQLGSEVLPSLVAYFRQAPDSNFWLRKEPN